MKIPGAVVYLVIGVGPQEFESRWTAHTLSQSTNQSIKLIELKFIILLSED